MVDGKKLREAAAGFVVIVVGVLVALAADAAWAQRQDRIREREALVDLLEEFRENRATLLDDIEANRNAQQSGRAWGDVMRGVTEASPDSAMALFVMALWDARFDPGTGALRSLVDGGQLDLIENLDLRRALAGWEDRVAEASLTARAFDGQRNALLTYLLDLPVDGALNPGQAMAVRVYVESVAGQNDQLEALVTPIDQIIAMIEAELER